MAGERAAASYPNPFAPASIAIHPLTRAERDASGRPLLICHLEMRDAWGDPCKGTGQLQVQLYRSVGGVGIGRQSGLGTQEVKWDVDLTNLEMQRLWDAATRTYRLELEGAPDWIVGPKRDEAAGRLRAVLTGPDAKGERGVLMAELGV